MKQRVLKGLNKLGNAAERFRPLLVAMVVFVAAITPAVAPYLERIFATHSGTHLLIFWDGTDGSIPAGWSKVNTYNGRYPRGESPANALQTGGGGTHTPTANLSIDSPTATQTNGSSNPMFATAAHGHSFSGSLTIGAASNSDEPAYRSLKLIQYDAGIPTDIPAGGIVFFDSNPGIPDSGWTRQAAQDNLVVKVDTSVGTGGNDSHTHSLAWPSLLASSGAIQSINSGNTGAPDNHTHTAPASPTATNSVSTLPPYIAPLMAKADSTALIPIGMLGMFDGDPGGSSGFTIRSSSGGTYHQQFLRPAATYNGTSQGSANHTHANHQGVTGGSGSSPGNNLVASHGAPPHAHTITAQFNAAENLPEYFNVVVAQRTGASMLLFWDGGAAPTGWSIFSDADGKFVRGDTVGNYGQTGGSGTHQPTVTSLTLEPIPDLQNELSTGSGNPPAASHQHTHPQPTLGIAAASNSDEPAFRSLKMISYDAGIPNIIPTGAIALFDNSPGIPTTLISPGNPVWSRVTAQDNLMIKANSSVGTGGSDSHTHTLTWSSVGAASGTVQLNNGLCFLGGCVTGAGSGHTHAAPTNFPTTPSVTTLPPYVQPLLAKANADTPTLSVGLTAMFNGDPGGGWVVRSDPGEPFYQQFLRPAATYNGTSQGQLNHSHVDLIGVTGVNSSVGGNTLNFALGNMADDHTHNIEAEFSDNTENLPEYFNIVIAEKVNFILEDYRWYVDSNVEDVTDPWASVNLAENTAITSLPPINDPPETGRELRLRIQVRIAGNTLAANAVELKLQYKADTDASCTTGTWTDVGAGGGGSVWRYATSGENDAEDLTQSRFTAASNVLQTYIKSASSGTNPNSVTIGLSTEYDFHIQHNGALSATQYSFRVLESSGILLSQYDFCPTLATRPETENLLRHGNFFENEVERGFFWAN